MRSQSPTWRLEMPSNSATSSRVRPSSIPRRAESRWKMRRSPACRRRSWISRRRWAFSVTAFTTHRLAVGFSSDSTLDLTSTRVIDRKFWTGKTIYPVGDATDVAGVRREGTVDATDVAGVRREGTVDVGAHRGGVALHIAGLERHRTGVGVVDAASIRARGVALHIAGRERHRTGVGVVDAASLCARGIALHIAGVDRQRTTGILDAAGNGC